MLKFIEYPKCSTCIKARKYLDQLGLEYTKRHIVDEKLNKEELLALYKKRTKINFVHWVINHNFYDYLPFFVL